MGVQVEIGGAQVVVAAVGGERHRQLRGVDAFGVGHRALATERVP